MIDEASRRRPDWVEGEWIKLEDGQRWSFPRPIIRLNLRENDGVLGTERPQAETNRKFGDRFWALHSNLLAALQGDDMDAIVLAFAEAALDLLRRNYDLATEDLEDVLFFVLNDEANTSMWRSIGDVVRGIGPKPSAAG